MGKIKTRMMQESDAPAVAAIHAQVLGTRQHEYKALKARSVTSRSPVMPYVAEADGEIVGFVMGETSEGEYGVSEQLAGLIQLGSCRTINGKALPVSSSKNSFLRWAKSGCARSTPWSIGTTAICSASSTSWGRVLVANPQNSVASPFGWHDTNGAAGDEFTITQGNNVNAYTDVDANNAVDAGSQPSGGASLVFDFPLDLTLAPSGYRPAAVTNLFYWNNIIHDIQYQYGFDEAAGNFQINNYGRGGLGNDSVRAEAQDGGGTNNANFATPADGSPPRMQMFIWTAPTPDRDGDVDSGIIIHEYGHGISNRLVGGPSNVSCLTNAQQPGEGLSDWWSLAYTAEVGGVRSCRTSRRRRSPRAASPGRGPSRRAGAGSDPHRR